MAIAATTRPAKVGPLGTFFSPRHRSARRLVYSRCLVVLTVLLTFATARPAFADGPGVNGRVLALDEKGVPAGSVAGAKIEFMNRAGKVAAKATSDAKGRYKADLPPGKYTYTVQAAGFKDEDAGRGISLTLSSGYALFDLSLIRGKTEPKKAAKVAAKPAVGTLTGRVQEKTAAGKLVDVPGATISLRKEGAKQLTKVVARSDDPKENGSYEVILDVGSYQASTAALGFETLVTSAPLAIADGKTETRVFVLTRAKLPEPSGQGIKGKIQFADSKAPAKVKISIRPLSEAGGKSLSANLDAKGSYQRDLPSGRYQVVVEADGFRTAASEPSDVFNGSYTVVDFSVAPAGKELLFVATVFERLTPEEGRKPLAAVTVLVRKEGAAITGAMRGTTGVDGKVSLKVSGPGKYQVIAQMKGYRTAGAQTEISAAGTNRADVELVKNGALLALHLNVVSGKDKAAQPIAGARIVVSEKGRPAESADSDAKGGHTFLLPAGTYQIEVGKSGYQVHKLEVRLAKEVTQEVVLAETGAKKATLTLRVMEKSKTGDKAVAGAEIVFQLNGKNILDSKSGADGHLAVPLSPGMYTVLVTRPNFKPASLQVNLGDKNVSHDLILVEAAAGVPAKKNATLTLRIVEKLKSGDKIIVGAEIVVSEGGKRILNGKSGPDGHFAAPLPAGSYTVVVTHAGFKTITMPMTLAAVNVNQDVVLVAGK